MNPAFRAQSIGVRCSHCGALNEVAVREALQAATLRCSVCSGDFELAPNVLVDTVSRLDRQQWRCRLSAAPKSGLTR